MDTLYDLRRAGSKNPQGSEELRRAGSKNPQSSEELSEQDAEGPDRTSPEHVLMTATLRDTEDTEKSLAALEAQLLTAQEPLPGLGGARHVSALISTRTVAVVRRKRELLRVVEERMAAFDRVHAKCEEVLWAIKQDANYTPPSELDGIDKFALRHTHEGDPAAANKADFLKFTSTFGLPAGHQVFRRMEEKAHEATCWWADAALREAKAGTDASTIQRLINLALNILGNPKHEAVVNSWNSLGDTLAENTLRNAIAWRDQEREFALWSDKVQPESARICAERINKEITVAVGMGAPSSHECIFEAKRIATQLEEEERERIARKVLEFAVHQQDNDATAALRAKGSPNVGPASWAADKIQQEIRKAVEKGVSEYHPRLKDAKNIAKLLRNEDTLRKRLAGREASEFRDS